MYPEKKALARRVQVHSLSQFPLDMGQRKRQRLLHLSSAPAGDLNTKTDHLSESVQLNEVPNVYLC